MSISSIVQIASRLSNGDFGQDSQVQGKRKLTPTASRAQSNRTEFGDYFTPSAQGEAANTAGGVRFSQAEQLRFTAVNVQAPAATAAAAPASPIHTLQDLQALNASLVALGLNATEIAAFDQFAGVLLQFDPNALQDLQGQLNLLAARFQAQNTAAAATPQTSATPLSFQLTELSISFSGLNGTLTKGNPDNGNRTTTQLSAFSRQIQEVRVTLSNPAGEAALLHY